MLEEIGLPYEVHAINIGQGDQFTAEYLAINPNNKIPSIVDPTDRAASRLRYSSPARS
jgi:GSH-dependent disulfide-bond oxidoreductase